MKKIGKNEYFLKNGPEKRKRPEKTEKRAQVTKHK
jgi:hypothetical protein